MSDELVLDSLQRRMRALHSLYVDAVATMDLDQVNHFEREGVLPIAFSLFHIVNMMDASFLLMTGTPPIWDETWEAAVRPAIADHGKHRTVAEMIHQRIGDYDAIPGLHGRGVPSHRGVVGPAGPERADPGGHRPAVPTPGVHHLQRPGGRARAGSPCSTPPSAGSTSTGSATWARSSWPGAWWAWAA